MNAPAPSPLPYFDTKPQGSADFFYAVNTTFRFLLQWLGPDGWRRYRAERGRGYCKPVNRQGSQGGLLAVARYWRALFAAEPGAGAKDVRLRPDWPKDPAPLDRYTKANDPDAKMPAARPGGPSLP